MGNIRPVCRIQVALFEFGSSVSDGMRIPAFAGMTVRR